MENLNTRQASEMAKEVLEEVAATLLRRGCILAHKKDCMVLAVARPGGKPAQAIAQVVEIAGRVVWRRIEQ